MIFLDLQSCSWIYSSPFLDEFGSIDVEYVKFASAFGDGFGFRKVIHGFGNLVG
jgi:hypothetical protein